MFGFPKKQLSAKAPPEVVLSKAQLQPRIKHQHFLRALQQAGVPENQQPPTMPLCGELIVTYAFDGPENLIMATPSMLEKVHVSASELSKLAIENLEGMLPQPQFFSKDGCGIAVTGEGLEATLLLVNSVWNDMQDNFTGEILATVPRRDCIMMCDSANPDAVASLRVQSAEFFNEIDDAHRLSTQIMVRRNGNWILFEQH